MHAIFLAESVREGANNVVQFLNGTFVSSFLSLLGVLAVPILGWWLHRTGKETNKLNKRVTYVQDELSGTTTYTTTDRKEIKGSKLDIAVSKIESIAHSQSVMLEWTSEISSRIDSFHRRLDDFAGRLSRLESRVNNNDR